MSQVSVSPEALTAAAANLETIAATIEEAHQAAAPMIQMLAPAAADEVSVSIANVFAEHAQEYQAVAGQALAFQGQFVQNLNAGAAAYLGVENVLVYLLRSLDAGVNWTWGQLTQLIINFVASADSWIELVPAPLQNFIIFGPFVSIFIGAIPFILLSSVIQNLIAALGG
ncbi:PE family protein [Mycobacterium intermedium]